MTFWLCCCADNLDASWTVAAGVIGAIIGAAGLGDETFSEGKQAIAQMINARTNPTHID